MLETKKILENAQEFISILNSFGERSENLVKLYSSFDSKELATAPASYKGYMHNAFAGGYIDHVIRVIEYSLKVHSLYEDLGFDLSNFTIEELRFSALNHDLGKLGYPTEGANFYNPCTNDWAIKNRDQMYEINTKCPYMEIPDRSIYLLQKYNIPISYNEFIAIRIHDGMYSDSNKSYLTSFDPSQRVTSQISEILHMADIMASRFENERWKKENERYINYPKV